MIFLNDFKFFYPEIMLGVSASTLLMFGVFNGLGSIRSTFKSSISASILVLVIYFFLIKSQPEFSYQLFGSHLSLDFLGKLLRLWLAFFALAVVSLSWSYYSKNQASYEYVVLMLLAIFGMDIIIIASDFVVAYLAIELQSLCLYVLAASNRSRTTSLEAGLKYFILGALASSFMLLGVSFIYGYTGLTNFYDLSMALVTPISLAGEDISGGLYFGLAFILVGILFKLPAAPFHSWAPDVYQGSPTIITAFFCACSKNRHIFSSSSCFVCYFFFSFSVLVEHFVFLWFSITYCWFVWSPSPNQSKTFASF